jgi:ABC-type glycerol-3-phosphate transport system permease component
MFLIILSFILTIVWVFTYAYDFVSMHFSGLDILMILMALYILSFLSLLMGKFISFQIQILENNTKIVEDNKKLLLSIQEDLMNVKEAIDVSKN